MLFQSEAKIEYGVLYPRLRDGKMDRVMPVINQKEAIDAVKDFRARGIPSEVISRSVSAWEIKEEAALDSAEETPEQ